jgi:hypothetical protein
VAYLPGPDRDTLHAAIDQRRDRSFFRRARRLSPSWGGAHDNREDEQDALRHDSSVVADCGIPTVSPAGRLRAARTRRSFRSRWEQSATSGWHRRLHALVAGPETIIGWKIASGV